MKRGSNVRGILVSACLLGEECRYDGKSARNQELVALLEEYMEQIRIVAVCPEEMGGIRTSRDPAELQNGRVVTKTGEDVTAAYLRGATKTLKTAQKFGCTLAVLKDRSPSCGKSSVYDGTFSGVLQPGSGVCAALLAQHGIRVLSEHELSELKAFLEQE